MVRKWLRCAVLLLLPLLQIMLLLFSSVCLLIVSVFTTLVLDQDQWKQKSRVLFKAPH